MNEPYVFIVTCPRSGTTLLHRMADAHPDVAIVFETHWIPRWFEKRRGLTPDGMVTEELARRLFEDRRFKNLKVRHEEVERLISSSEPMPYPAFVTALFDLHGRVKGKSLVGEKTPGYVRNIPTLHYLWPEARFVHLISDGRDVFLSMKNWKWVYRAVGRFAAWTRDPVSTSAFVAQLAVELRPQRSAVLATWCPTWGTPR